MIGVASAQPSSLPARAVELRVAITNVLLLAGTTLEDEQVKEIKVLSSIPAFSTGVSLGLPQSFGWVQAWLNAIDTRTHLCLWYLWCRSGRSHVDREGLSLF